MRFNLHGPTAAEVVECITIYKTKNEVIARAFSDLEKYIRDQELNDVVAERDIDWSVYNPTLEDGARKLMEAFAIVDIEDFSDAISRPFEAAKIAMAFYRNVRTLAKFEKRKLVQFPGA